MTMWKLLADLLPYLWLIMFYSHHFYGVSCNKQLISTHG